MVRVRRPCRQDRLGPAVDADDELADLAVRRPRRWQRSSTWSARRRRRPQTLGGWKLLPPRRRRRPRPRRRPPATSAQSRVTGHHQLIGFGERPAPVSAAPAARRALPLISQRFVDSSPTVVDSTLQAMLRPRRRASSMRAPSAHAQAQPACIAATQLAGVSSSTHAAARANRVALSPTSAIHPSRRHALQGPSWKDLPIARPRQARQATGLETAGRWHTSRRRGRARTARSRFALPAPAHVRAATFRFRAHVRHESSFPWGCACSHKVRMQLR